MTEAHSPATLEEAIRLLGATPRPKPLAGCTDLMVGDPEEQADRAAVIDLLRIPELKGIRARDGGLEIGATTTFHQIATSEVVRRLYPILAEAAAVVGGWQIQNRATVGGNIVNASPAGDSLPVLLALDATAVAVGPDGPREIPYDQFHVGYRRTALEAGELLGWIRLPAPAAGSIQRFRKVGTREAQAISKVVAAMTGRVRDGRIDLLRLAAGSVAATPIRLTAIEEEIVGREPGDEAAELAARLAGEAVEPIDDVRSTAAYRRFALGRVVRRFLLELGA